ncbi:MAG: regulatory protein RecX [Nitrospirota bacterium]
MLHGRSDEIKNTGAEKAMAVALRLLSYRDRSRKELFSRLTKKGFPDDVVETIMARLQELGLINDENLARSMVSLCQRRLAGKECIWTELIKRGIDRELGMEVIREFYREDVEEENAMTLAQKRMRILTNTPPDITKRRVADYLRRRGYSFDIIHRTLNKLFT